MNPQKSNHDQAIIDSIKVGLIRNVEVSRPDRIVCREKPYHAGDCFCLDWNACDGQPVVRVSSMDICQGCWPSLLRATMRRAHE